MGGCWWQLDGGRPSPSQWLAHRLVEGGALPTLVRRATVITALMIVRGELSGRSRIYNKGGGGSGRLTSWEEGKLNGLITTEIDALQCTI